MCVRVRVRVRVSVCVCVCVRVCVCAYVFVVVGGFGGCTVFSKFNDFAYEQVRVRERGRGGGALAWNLRPITEEMCRNHSSRTCI